MGIRLCESDSVFHVPYGPPNSDGTFDSSFVDLKAHPEWVPIIPPCLGWPETQALLQTLNSPRSPLMTLATHQGVTSSGRPEFDMVLASFVTLCYADFKQNHKQALTDLALFLDGRLSELLQAVSNALERSLLLTVLLELQPTVYRQPSHPAQPPYDESFSLDPMSGWSLTVYMAAYGGDHGEARETWRLGMRALQSAFAEWKP